MNFTSNRAKVVVDYYIGEITALYPPEESASIVWLLMEQLFSINRFEVAMNPSLRLSESELVRMHNACKKVLRNIPVQYITGQADFCGLSLHVNPTVLIPRPETEQLVQMIANDLGEGAYTLLDVGTGSGAIAIALKKSRPDCSLMACDISEDALAVARENAALNQTAIELFQCDVLAEDAVSRIPVVDVVVSNPPYVCLSEQPAMRPNVLQHEPHGALFVEDSNPLLFYTAIINLAGSRLQAGGRLFFEINERFGGEVSLLLEQAGFTNIIVTKDFRNKERFVSGVKE